jgi:hypothetical protein
MNYLSLVAAFSIGTLTGIFIMCLAFAASKEPPAQFLKGNSNSCFKPGGLTHTESIPML